RGTTWNGAGAWWMPSQSRHENFSRTLRLRSGQAVLDHLPLAGDHLERLGDVLAQLAEPCAAAAWTGRRTRHDYPLTRQMLGERLARRPLARERRHVRRLRRGLLCRQLVFRG